METRAGYMVVGGFVLLSIVGILTFLLWLAKTDLDYKVKYYTIYFPGSVTGLTVGGAVNYLGVPVGTVKDISLESGNFQTVNITIAIRTDIPIKEDAYASLELQGLTGYKLVQIYGGSQDSPLLKAKVGERYPVIQAKYSGVEEVMSSLPRMVNKFTNLIDRINSTFNEENRERFSNVLKNINELTQKLAESSGPLKQTIEEVQQALKLFNREFTEISSSAKGAFSKVDLVTLDMSEILAQNKIALDTLAQSGSYELIQTLGEAKEMFSTASGFFEKLEESPSSLIFDSQRKGVSIPQ